MHGMMHPLYQYRKDNDLTLEGFASRFGVNKTTAMRWEDGNISAERALEIAKKTGIPKEKLRPDIFGNGSAA